MTKLIALYIQIAMQWNEMKWSRMFSRECWYTLTEGGNGEQPKKATNFHCITLVFNLYTRLFAIVVPVCVCITLVLSLILLLVYLHTETASKRETMCTNSMRKHLVIKITKFGCRLRETVFTRSPVLLLSQVWKHTYFYTHIQLLMLTYLAVV